MKAYPTAFERAAGTSAAQIHAALLAVIAKDANLDPKGWRTDENGNRYHIDPDTGRKDAGWGGKANGRRPRENKSKPGCRKTTKL